MAAVRTLEAASSFNVFLSFRGKDTRKTFTDHLYTALVAVNFRTFRDKEGIERGENIKLELGRAFMHSRCSIIVLSEDYASSGWCLVELVMILEVKKKQDLRYVVLPIFYHVDPSDLKKQKGRIKNAFDVHEEQCRAETRDERKKEMMEKVKGWREALRPSLVHGF
ncbi:hypothetical protein LguiA_026859 [Lonicera macranthoides]